VRWLRANAARYGIDPERIALGGGSAGGQIASLAGVGAGVADFEPDGQDDLEAGAAVSSEVQAIVNIDGLSDFTDPLALQFEDDPRKQPSAAGAWFGGRYFDKAALWRQASPLFHVTARTPPVLFIASAQPRFSVGRVAMAQKLDGLGIANRTLILPDTPHSFWLFDPWLAPTVAATLDFLDREMRARPAP
jgi:acetyl esterase/lipase